MPSSADGSFGALTSRMAVVAALVACAVGGCSSDTSRDNAPREGSAGNASSASSATSVATAASPSAAATVTAAEVADLVEKAAGAEGSAAVRITIGTQCTFEGTAQFGAAPTLVGSIDFRGSESDSDYVARDLEISVTVPPGEDFPGPTTARPNNPWGPAMSRIDPSVVPLAIRGHGTGVVVRPGVDGAVSYLVDLEGPGTLTAFGVDPSPDLPESVRYVIELDSEGRLVGIHADFDHYGDDFVTLEWT